MNKPIHTDRLRGILRAPAGVVLTVCLTCLSAAISPPAAAEEQRLTSDGKQKSGPIFRQGGKEVVYTVQDRSNQLSLMRLRLQDGRIEALHPGATTSEFSARFADNDQQYVFARNNGNLHVVIVIRHSARGTSLEFNPGGGFAGVRSVTIAPDALRVVFAFPDQQGAQQIFSLGLDGKDRRALTKGGGIDGYPAFTADGKRIAFASTRTGNFDIFSMTATGALITQLTDHRGLDIRPAWSPDGKRIAFTSLRNGNYDIYVMDAAGNHTTRLTTHSERDDYPCWHPNGRQIVTVSERDGRQDLYLLDVPDDAGL